MRLGDCKDVRLGRYRRPKILSDTLGRVGEYETDIAKPPTSD